jgi:ketosteroid isomerase-like protein
MKRNSSRTVLTACCLALLTSGCSQLQGGGPDNKAAAEVAIRQADSTWSTVAEAKQVDQHVAYFLDDGIVLPPNDPMVSGKDAIHKMISDFFSRPGFAVKWQVTKVEAAHSGDLGYSVGTFELSMNDSTGKPMMDRGKYTTVWKKQPDGTWKVAVDMFNSDLPAPQPPS